MSADTNIKTIAQIYEAFGRGDVAAILDGITDDVDWAAETTSTAAPWYGVRHGKESVAGFFAAFGSAMEVGEFTPVSFALTAQPMCWSPRRAIGCGGDGHAGHRATVWHRGGTRRYEGFAVA